MSRVITRIRMPDQQTRGKLLTLARAMRKLVLRGKKSLFVREFVARLLNKEGVKQKEFWKEIVTLHRFVRDKIMYRKDPVRVEFFQTPEKMLRDYLRGQSAGDCDDKSILLAAMLESIGHKTMLVLVNPRGGQYTHVLPFVNYPPRSNNWIPLETTLPVEPGWMPKTFKKGIIRIFEEKE